MEVGEDSQPVLGTGASKIPSTRKEVRGIKLEHVQMIRFILVIQVEQ